MKHPPRLKLVLQDGTEFVGRSFGFFLRRDSFETDGEVVFNTGMAGYPESLTDPSYRGQILVFSYPLIGNYGVPPDRITKGLASFLESQMIHVRGVIVSAAASEYSHWQGKETLSDWLKRYKIPAIEGVDTRHLTQILREKGTMLGKIVHPNKKFVQLGEFTEPSLTNLVAQVSCPRKKVFTPSRFTKTIVAYDCGMKENIIRSFVRRGVRVIRLPWDYPLLKLREPFNGVFVSNGPGDPKRADKTIESLAWALRQGFPTFGICLGSQLMALAIGADTYKLKYGHRSVNQPCIDLKTGRCYITSQNHGFAVDPNTIPRGWAPWFINANDGTIEGIRHKRRPFFSVQFHPEACPGPEDTAYLFDEFIARL